MSKLPIFEHFLSVGNLKPKLELIFQAKMLSIELGPSKMKQSNCWRVKSKVAPKEKCPYCEEYFAQGSKNLESHKKREHLWGDFSCSECQFQANFVREAIQ